MFYRLYDKGTPGTETEQHDGYKEPCRFVSAVDLRKVTQKMFMDEIEFKKLGIGPVDQNMPGRGDQQKQQEAAREIHGFKNAPFPQQYDPDADHHPGDQDADQSFGHDCQSSKRIKTPHEKPSL